VSQHIPGPEERSSGTGHRESEAHGLHPAPDTPTLRAFVAVEVGEELARRAAQIVERLRGAGDVKWVEPGHFHLTIKFLGATRRADLPRLSEALREAARRAAPFDLELAGVGAFPSLQRPQVVWLGVTSGREALAQLAGAAEEACAALGWSREARTYRAHMTLGRSKDRRPRRRDGERQGAGGSRLAARTSSFADLARRLEAERDTPAGATRVDRLVLMQSQLRPDGPIYSVIDSFPLGGSSE
jgi:2'-5' RNA ligase